MRFWWREVAGWALVLIGLAMFGACYYLLAVVYPPRIVESGPLTIIGIIVFRGGIHLLKVAVAARVCLHAAESGDARAQPRPTGPSRKDVPRSRIAGLGRR
jgi:hypothetical protein